MTESALNEIAQWFVLPWDVFYFQDDVVATACLQHGLTVYTREEFSSTFRLFALNYGAVYHLWSMKLPNEAYVVRLTTRELDNLPPSIRERLLIQQVEYKRGHIYDAQWVGKLQIPSSVSIVIDGAWHYFLTWNDWWGFTPNIRRRWIVEWLREWRKDEPVGVTHFPHDQRDIPYELIAQYAGTIGAASTPNCFAAAIAMVVGMKNPDQARALITQWLHQGPFFRLLQGQGYLKQAEYRDLSSLEMRSGDVLVWYTGDQLAGHAGYAMSHDLVFQKLGQGWDNPWQILKFADIGYNDYLDAGGHITVYRRATEPNCTWEYGNMLASCDPR